jgi:hypothetical protein
MRLIKKIQFTLFNFFHSKRKEVFDKECEFVTVKYMNNDTHTFDSYDWENFKSGVKENMYNRNVICIVDYKLMK